LKYLREVDAVIYKIYGEEGLGFMEIYEIFGKNTQK